MDICGEVVSHKLFGTGHITRFANNYVTVLFDENDLEKEFVYPSAFGAFLRIKNDSFQVQIDADKSSLAQLTPQHNPISDEFSETSKTLVAKKPKLKSKPKSIGVKK